MNSTQSFSNRSELSCVVIGAGPGGIVATKELLEQGETDVICLEKSDRLGGIFSGAYDSLTLTSSCAYSMFSDHWIGDGNEHHFWTKAEVVDYWTAYARRFGAAAPGSLGGARPAPPAVDVPRLKMLTLPSESKPAR
jgi:dimethylaniline monooxygenase (N-oxide forming)